MCGLRKCTLLGTTANARLAAYEDVAHAFHTATGRIVTMIDPLLSQCLLAFVGTPGHLDDMPPEERVVEIAPNVAHDLLPRIKAIVDEVYSAEPPLWQSPSISEMGRQVEAFVTARHPGLSPEAVNALANSFCFDWK